ncbi:MAG: glycoside hydrolase family 25 protein [Lachnospiraceae bacterium]
MGNKRADLIVIALSLVFVIGIVLCVAFLYLPNYQSKEASAEVVETELSEQEALSLLTDEAYEAALQEGRDEVLASIKENILESNSTMNALRAAYTDDIVVYSDGVLRFIPVEESVPKTEVLRENIEVLETGEFQYIEDGTVVSQKGIDVSKYQGDIDWEQVAADGVTYAFLRVGIRGYGSGAIVLDETFHQNVEGAQAAGIEVGIYFYSQAITVDEAIEEVDFILSEIAGYAITYPIVMDVEMVGESGARADALTIDERTEIAIAFCEQVITAGYVPMIYGNTETFTTMLDITAIVEYERWIAFYDDELYFPYEFAVWQYTHAGSVAGIDGETDLNISFKTW